MTSSYDMFIAAAPLDALTAIETLLRRGNFSVVTMPGRILRAHRLEHTQANQALVALTFDLQMFDGPGGSAVARLYRTHPTGHAGQPTTIDIVEEQFRTQIAILSNELTHAGNRNSTTLE